MEQKSVLKLLVLFLGFSFVLASAAVPTSRSLKSFKDDPSVQDLLAQDGMDMRIDGDLPEVFQERRMMATYNTGDYGPTGANKNHDPPNPGP